MIRRDSSLHHPDLHRFSHGAMATVFEVFIFHEDKSYSHQAAMEAFRLVESLESDLSRYIQNGDIARINSLKAGESTRIGIHAFSCLERGIELGLETGGCFNIFLGFLKDQRSDEDFDLKRTGGEYGFRRPAGPTPLELNAESYEVRVSERATIDLGAFGKGYAVDRMAESLREWGIESALVHGGRSSVYAFGWLPERAGWPVTISHPRDRRKILGRFELHDRAMGASGLEKGPHIFDPRTGEPVRDRAAAWVLGPDAATADALSTAFMVMEPEEVRIYCAGRSDLQAVTMIWDGTEEGDPIKVMTFGISSLKGN
jgi:FAD:protein FMN transferase